MLINGEALSLPFSKTEWETKVEGSRSHSPRLPAFCRVPRLVLRAGGGGVGSREDRRGALEPGFHESEKNTGR